MGPIYFSFAKTIRTLLHHPEGIVLLAFLIFAALPTVVSLIFAPWFFSFISLVTFLGIVWIVFKKTQELLSLKITEELERKEFESLIHYLDDGIVLYDPSFKILLLNRAVENLFKLSSSELEGRVVDPSLIRNPHFRSFAQTLFPSLAIAMTQVSQIDTWPQIVDLTTDSPLLQIRTTLHRISSSRGEVIGFLRTIRDRTREKELLSEKNDFIDVAAHQLRTPLTAIGWAMGNLLKLTESSSEEIRSLVKETSEISQRALKITNDLLDVSKIEEGRFGFVYQETNLVELVKKILVTTTPLAKQLSVDVYMNPLKESSYVVRVDPSRISSVLLNLIDNAIKYNVQNGKVIVSIAKSENGSFIKISIEDTGIGIPPADINNLFRKLQRGSNAAQAEPNGSGLGLYIAKNIVEQHGGTIGFTSVLNRGTTFWFTLPYQEQKSFSQNIPFSYGRP